MVPGGYPLRSFSRDLASWGFALNRIPVAEYSRCMGVMFGVNYVMGRLRTFHPVFCGSLVTQIRAEAIPATFREWMSRLTSGCS